MAGGCAAIRQGRVMSGPPTWRNLIEVHPAADLFPTMSQGEMEELAADIRVNGQRVGVTLWTPDTLEDILARQTRKKSQREPQKVFLLDGRNRLTALEMAYEAEVAEGAYDDDDDTGVDGVIRAALETDPRDGRDQSTATLLYSDDVDPHAYVVSANIRRRHLTAEQEREIIARLLKANPERSDRATARLVGTSPSTVGAIRREGEESGGVSKLDTRTDTTGRQQPARKPRPEPNSPKLNANAIKMPTQPQPAQHAKSEAAPGLPARDLLDDIESVEWQVEALMRAWDAAGPEARQQFLQWI